MASAADGYQVLQLAPGMARLVAVCGHPAPGLGWPAGGAFHGESGAGPGWGRHLSRWEMEGGRWPKAWRGRGAAGRGTEAQKLVPAGAPAAAGRGHAGCRHTGDSGTRDPGRTRRRPRGTQGTGDAGTGAATVAQDLRVVPAAKAARARSSRPVRPAQHVGRVSRPRPSGRRRPPSPTRRVVWATRSHCLVIGGAGLEADGVSRSMVIDLYLQATRPRAYVDYWGWGDLDSHHVLVSTRCAGSVLSRGRRISPPHAPPPSTCVRQIDKRADGRPPADGSPAPRARSPRVTTSITL